MRLCQSLRARAPHADLTQHTDKSDYDYFKFRPLCPFASLSILKLQINEDALLRGPSWNVWLCINTILTSLKEPYFPALQTVVLDLFLGQAPFLDSPYPSLVQPADRVLEDLSKTAMFQGLLIRLQTPDEPVADADFKDKLQAMFPRLQKRGLLWTQDMDGAPRTVDATIDHIERY